MLALIRATRIACGLSPLLLLFGCYSSPYHSGFGYGAPYTAPPGGHGAPPGGYVVPPGGASPNPTDGSLGQPGNVGGNDGARNVTPARRKFERRWQPRSGL